MLALTLLLPDQLVQHVDIKEGAKVGGDGAPLRGAAQCGVAVVGGQRGCTGCGLCFGGTLSGWICWCGRMVHWEGKRVQRTMYPPTVGDECLPLAGSALLGTLLGRGPAVC